jgi:hypothetical protein
MLVLLPAASLQAAEAHNLPAHRCSQRLQLQEGSASTRHAPLLQWTRPQPHFLRPGCPCLPPACPSHPAAAAPLLTHQDALVWLEAVEIAFQQLKVTVLPGGGGRGGGAASVLSSNGSVDARWHRQHQPLPRALSQHRALFHTRPYQRLTCCCTRPGSARRSRPPCWRCWGGGGAGR